MRTRLQVRVQLAGCSVRVVTESLRGGKSLWWKKGPLEVVHEGGRPLMGGCSVFYLFVDNGGWGWMAASVWMWDLRGCHAE